MKKYLGILISLILSLLIVFGWPKVFSNAENIFIDNKSEKTKVSQKVLEYSNKENNYYKLYHSGELIGVITNIDKINKAIEDEYKNYEEDFPNSKLGLKDDYYIMNEKSYLIFEDADEEIIKYLIDESALGVSATAVEFSTKEGIYDIIYVKNIDDFYKVRDEFLLNFVSSDTINKLRNNEAISDPNDFGTVETNIKVQETISYEDAIVSPDDIFTSEEEIYEYLCYGRNKEREYYLVNEGDTLQTVGYYFGDMTPKQIVMLNKDVLSSEDQLLVPGTELNVTYYTSPITITVTKKRLTQEALAPETPIYREDESIPAGKTEIITEEQFGLRNVMYEETWINGVVQSSDIQFSNVVREPVQGIIALGTKYVVTTGTGNFIWPVDDPRITCGYGNVCYYGHTGTDFQSRGYRWGNVYAVDSGVVASVGYDGIGGNNVIIDHNNGYRTYYGHLNTTAFVSVGESVDRGQVIGQVGMTGLASGPHCHLQLWVNGVMVDPCSVMPCSLLYY